MTTIVRTGEGELWAKAVSGDHAAFGLLFDRHSKAIYNHCFRLTASWAMAEDATQSTFLTAWRKRDRVRLINDSALPWLLSTATNAVRAERRSARRWIAALLRMPPDRDAADELADEVADRVDDVRRMRPLLRAVGCSRRNVNSLRTGCRACEAGCSPARPSRPSGTGDRHGSPRWALRWLPAPPLLHG